VWQCKTRGERKISFAEFHDALTMISEHKQVSKHDLVNFLLQAEGPVVYAAQAEKTVRGSVLERLTDTKRYTGAHKHRFDENGRGRGLQGRTSDGVSSVRDPLGQVHVWFRADGLIRLPTRSRSPAVIAHR
jgi:hypothetical protein